MTRTLTPRAQGALFVLCGALLVGVAYALADEPLTIAATAGVGAGDQGVAGGLVNAPFQVGPALALAAVAAVIEVSGSLWTALAVPLAITITGLAVVATGLRVRTTTYNPTV
jgi:hypothetical protein